MAIKFIPSNYIGVFPSGYRDARHAQSKYMSETNLSKFGYFSSDLLKNNFIITSPEDTSEVIIGVGGYIFNAKKEALDSIVSGVANVYAYIKLKQFDAVEDLGEVLSNVTLSSSSAEATILDVADSSEEGEVFNFKGLGFSALSSEYGSNPRVQVTDSEGNLLVSDFRIKVSMIAGNTSSEVSLTKTLEEELYSENIETKSFKTIDETVSTSKITDAEINNLKVINSITGPVASENTLGLVMPGVSSENNDIFGVLVDETGHMTVKIITDKIPHPKSEAAYSDTQGIITEVSEIKEDGEYVVKNYTYELKDLTVTSSPTFRSINLTANKAIVGTGDTLQLATAGTISVTNNSESHTIGFGKSITVGETSVKNLLSIEPKGIYVNNLCSENTHTKLLNVYGDSTIGGTKSNSLKISVPTTISSTVSLSNTLTSTSTITAKSFTATSDKRLKDNIEEFKITKSILDLPIYTYTFKNDSAKHIGCLAQDLKEICPELVFENENGYLSIEESKLVYLLINEVKELKQKIENLK